MSDRTMEDRRTRPRIAVAVELKLHAPGQHFTVTSRTVDLSTNGAFVRTNRPLPVGATVTLAFTRGNSRNPLEIDAEVVRSGTTDGGRQSGIALRFTHLSEVDESLLQELIERSMA